VWAVGSAWPSFGLKNFPRPSCTLVGTPGVVRSATHEHLIKSITICIQSCSLSPVALHLPCVIHPPFSSITCVSTQAQISCAFFGKNKHNLDHTSLQRLSLAANLNCHPWLPIPLLLFPLKPSIIKLPNAPGLKVASGLHLPILRANLVLLAPPSRLQHF
jgi:hypothetical protein